MALLARRPRAAAADEVRDDDGPRAGDDVFAGQVDGGAAASGTEKAPLQPVMEARVGARAARAGFFATCRLPLVLGLGIPLAVGPFTSWPGDVYVWYQAVTRASLGVRPYTLPGFSYPPLWGYVLGAFGLTTHLAHIGQAALGSPNPVWLQQPSSYLPPVVTSLLFNAVLKAVLVAMELGAAWFLWRLVMILRGDAGLGRRAVSLFVLSPIVLVSVGLHGAFDVMIPLLVLGSLVARLEQRPVVAGACLALGVVAKIEPIFLIPLFLATFWWPLAEDGAARPTAASRLRDAGLFGAGGFGVAAVVLAPIALAGNISSLMVDVFTRSDGPAALGGLGLSGILRMPGLEPALQLFGGRGNHAVGVALEAAMVLGALAAAVAWARTSRRTGKTLVAFSAVVIAVGLLVSPVTQPQYLVWLVGPMCALACGNTAVRWLTTFLGTAGAAYLLGIAGPLLVLAPVFARVGSWPALSRSVVSFTGAPGASGITPGEVVTSIASGASIAGLLAVAAVMLRGKGIVSRRAAHDPGVEDSRAAREADAAHARGRRVSVRVFAGLGVVLAASEAAAVLPLPSALPAVLVTELRTTPARNVVLRLSASSGSLPADVVAFPSSGLTAVRRVVFYEDIAYPDSGSTWAATMGVQDNLEGLAKADQLPWRFSSVTTDGLRRLLLETSEAKGTVLFVTSGVLPQPVFSRSIDLLRPWLASGGLLVWTGDVPGYYASGPSSVVATKTLMGSGATPRDAVQFSPQVEALGFAGLSRLLGTRVGFVNGPWYGTATEPSVWAAALHLQYPYVHAGPLVDSLRAAGGIDLGYESDRTVSIAYMRVGTGGVLLFDGFTFASLVASDAARILESGCLTAVGNPSALSLRPGQARTLTVSLPPKVRSIVVMSFNGLVPGVTVSTFPARAASRAR